LPREKKPGLLKSAINATGAPTVFREIRANVSAVAAAINPYGNATGTSEVSVPKNWIDRVKKSREYAKNVDALAMLIKLRRSFLIGDGIRLRVEGDPEATERLRDFAQKIMLNDRVSKAFRNCLESGEAIAFKKFDGSDFQKLRLINNLSVSYEMEDDEITSLTQYNGVAGVGAKKIAEWSGIDLENFLVLRNDADDWDTRGEPATLQAFPAIVTYQNYGKAENTLARRFATVIRILKIGGIFGNTFVNPKAADITDAKTKLDALTNEEALVAPWHWDVKTYGAEGAIIDVPPRMKFQVARICWALGFQTFFVDGASALAGARVLLKASRYQIIHDTLMIRELLDWFFDPEILAQAGIDADAKVSYQFTGLSVDDEEWVAREDREMYLSGAMSRYTWMTRRGLDPDFENERIATEDVNLPPTMSFGELSALVGAQAIDPATAAALINLPIAQQEDVAAAASFASVDAMYRHLASRVSAGASAATILQQHGDAPPPMLTKKTKG